jgi:hypothetical protein
MPSAKKQVSPAFEQVAPGATPDSETGQLEAFGLVTHTLSTPWIGAPPHMPPPHIRTLLHPYSQAMPSTLHGENST